MALTGSVLEGEPSRHREAGMDGFLEKPFNLQNDVQMGRTAARNVPVTRF